MLKLVCLVCLSLFLSGGEIDQILVLDGDKNSKQANRLLHKIQKQFNTNKDLKKLQEKYHLHIDIEEAYGYKMIVVKPVHTQQLKKELLFYTASIYKDPFFINNRIMKKEILKEPLPLPKQHFKEEKKRDLKTVTQKPKRKESKQNIGDKTDVIWFIVWLLSVVGLIVAVYQRKKLMKLKDIEKEIEYRQDKMSKEIKLGEV